MRRSGHHDHVTLNHPMKKMIHPSRLRAHMRDLDYLQSVELVTPCRLLIVLVGSIVMVLLIAYSASEDEFTYQSFHHADLRVNLSSGPYHVNHKLVQLGRDDMLDMYGYNPPGDKVEKRSKMSLQEFWDLYDGKWPVIVTDIVPNWTAYKEWSKDFFQQKYGADRVILKAVQGILQEGVAHIRDMRSFISHLEQPVAWNSWTYMEDELFLMLRPELKEYIGSNYLIEENFFNLFPEEIRPWDAMLLWGTKFSRSTLHMDPYNWTAVSAVIWGRKKWKRSGYI